jgi:hypothetical protein
MEELVIYLLKSGCCLIVFFGIYYCFLRNETFHLFNRYLLLAGIFCSILLPFYQYSYIVNINTPVSSVLQTETIKSTHHNGPTAFWRYALLFIYTSVTCFLGVRHLVGLLKIRKMIICHGYTFSENYKVINTSVFKSSFSVFNYIFIDTSVKSSAVEHKLILEHELAHVKQNHWIDLLVCQLICMVQWFNPFAWLYLYAIKQNHEFLADKSVLQKGNSAAVYRAAMINHSLKTPVFTFASPFAHYDKFKRIKMMTKAPSRPIKKWSVLTVVPVLMLFLFAFAKPAYITVPIKHQNRTAVALSVPEAAAPAALAMSGKKILQTVRNKKVKPVLLISRNLADKTNEPAPDTIKAEKPPVYLLDGIEVKSIKGINSNEILAIDVYKADRAVEKFGQKGINGVVVLTSKPIH